MTTSVTLSLGYVAVYVALAGVASFIEKPAGRGFGAFQRHLKEMGEIPELEPHVSLLGLRPRTPCDLPGSTPDAT